jgi:hypothetical protein
VQIPLPSRRLVLRWQSWLGEGLERLKAGDVWDVELGRRIVRATCSSGGPQEEFRPFKGESFGATSEAHFTSGHSAQ